MFWRVELYSQTTIVDVPRTGTLAVSVDGEPEQHVYGSQNVFIEYLNSLATIHWQRDDTKLILTTYGIPFVVDSPDFKISTELTEDWALIQSPCVFDHRKVWAYYEELSKAIESLNLRDIAQPQADRILYPEFRGYYQKLINSLAPEIDADKIRSESRHALCICTPPVEENGKMRLGLSGTMQLLGYKPAAETKNESEPISDIDPVLALIADCTLIFKRQSEMLFKRFGVGDLSQIANHASSRLEAARSDSDAQHRKLKNPPPPPENKKWDEMKEDAIAKLSKLNVPMPSKF